MGALALALVLALSAQACVATTTAPPARAIIVTGPPPAPLVEERTPRTQALAIWIPGYWHWTGIQYAWIPGHWDGSPPSGATWRAPKYVKNEGVYLYEPGTWFPAAVTETPGRANAFH